MRRQQSGIYTCVAHNLEGDGVSNPVTLNVRCKYDDGGGGDDVFLFGDDLTKKLFQIVLTAELTRFKSMEWLDSTGCASPVRWADDNN